MAEYLDRYGETLKKQLIELCTARGLLNGELLIVEELEERWKVSAPQYMADAVPEIKYYPTVAIGWACFYGMGAAALWDAAWDTYKDVADLYLYLRDKRKFDFMDEYVMEELLCIDKDKSDKLSNIIGDCSALALTLFRKEGIEAQSVEAFYMFAKTTEIFFKIGVSIELTRIGYKYEKVILN